MQISGFSPTVSHLHLGCDMQFFLDLLPSIFNPSSRFGGAITLQRVLLILARPFCLN